MRVMNINNLNSERIMKDKQYLYNWYNATSTDDGTGEIETYENWLERQLISRIEKLETLEKANEQHSERRQLTIPDVSGSLPYYEKLLIELWYKRNPCHEHNSNSGEDMFWRTAFMVFEDYVREVSRNDR